MNPEQDYEARLLVVDDEPNIRDLLATSLRFAGFEVFTASTGNEAIREATENQPDLVVLDVMLPDMDGFTVTRRLRDRGEQYPILFLTARDETQDKVAGLTVGGTTTSPSPSAWKRSSPASGPCCAAPTGAARPPWTAPWWSATCGWTRTPTRSTAATSRSSCPPPSSSCCAT